MAKKLIITSKYNLELKYKKLLPHVIQLLQKLADNDEKIGINTSIVYVDDVADNDHIKNLTAKKAKETIDYLYNTYEPDYIVIFGAQDVFPFQEINNLLYSPGKDDDKIIQSDLPYSCQSSFSEDWNMFTNPIRVVSRIPDLPGDNKIDYINVVIENIIKFKPQSKEYYESYFASTAKVWSKSTEQTIKNIFGNKTDLTYCPPTIGASLSNTQLNFPSHFYNCHGALATDEYYGQDGGSFPASINSSQLNGKVSFGSVVAAECCYGIQLFDSLAQGKSIANNYLYNGAVSFLGSSTIAYGPSEGQDLADLICQYYFQNVLKGASCGRALLEARQRFISECGPTLNPYQLKTLMQFYTFGDPSIQLVIKPKTNDLFETIKSRRIDLIVKGQNLFFNTYPTVKIISDTDNFNQKSIENILDENGFSNPKKMTFVAGYYKGNEINLFSKTLLGLDSVKFEVYQQNIADQIDQKNNTVRLKVLVVKLQDEIVLSYKIYFSK